MITKIIHFLLLDERVYLRSVVVCLLVCVSQELSRWGFARKQNIMLWLVEMSAMLSYNEKLYEGHIAQARTVMTPI